MRIFPRPAHDSTKEKILDPANHGWGDDLERYILGQLAQDRVNRLEDHLLECGQCRTALDEAVVYHRAMRKALEQEKEIQPTAGLEWLRFNWLRTPSFALAIAALLMVAVAGWFVSRSSTPVVPLATIELIALRGEMPVIGQAQETDLHLKDIGNIAGNAEVVNANGGSVWKGPLTPSGSLHINQSLAAGIYFVRVYEGSKLVHEYGFRVRQN